jgi:ubiquinone/menaquinone biosynthesis C-methylase UbiE
MNLTQEEIVRSGYKLQAAPDDAWRIYDESDPIPGYFQFDWLSSRHPDLYHQFALSTVGLMEKLHTLIDLTGCDVLDIGAGTGRSAIGAAEKAGRVFALDYYEAVVFFGKSQLQQTHTTNVHYINGNRDHLPIAENSIDIVINAWAELNPEEAYRVLKPSGYLIQLGAAPDALCGELTSELASEYPWLIKDCAPLEVFQPGYPDTYGTADRSIWNGIPLAEAIHVQQFTYVADYTDYAEAAAMMGRLYGPKAKHYFLSRKQSTYSWRLQILMGQVSKDVR